MGRNRYGYCLIGCEGGRYLTEKIDAELKGSEGYRGTIKSESVKFHDGEIEARIMEHVRGSDVYIIQQLYSPTTSGRNLNDNLFELCLTIQAAGKADAHKITAVIPYHAYSRADRRSGKDEGIRKSIGAKLVADVIVASGADKVMSFDIHNESIEAFYPNRFPVENIYQTNLFNNKLKNDFPEYLENAVMLALDLGGAKRVARQAKIMGLPLAVVEKGRDTVSGELKIEGIMGDVRGKYCVCLDDIGGTFGTFQEGGGAAMASGALGIIGGVSFPLFVGPAIERMDKMHEEGGLIAMLGTDAVWHGEEFLEEHPYFSYIPLAPTLANTIRAIQRGEDSLHQELDVKPLEQNGLILPKP